MEGVAMNKKHVTSDALDFIRHNVYNVSDMTRKNKLTEILQKFVKPTDEAFVIENTRDKEAKGVLIDLKYFEQLLKYKEAVDQAIDQAVDEEAIRRIESGKADQTISLDEALSGVDVDWDAIDKELNDGKN